MDRLFSFLLVFAVCVAFSVPVFADSVSSSSASVASSSASVASSAPAVEFDGADSVVGEVNTTLDSAYENMPVQDSGVLGFMAGVTAAIPLEFISAIVLSLILGLVLLLLKFLWR